MRMRRLSRASAAKTRSPTAESSMFTRPLAAQGRPRRSPDHNTPPADVTAPPPPRGGIFRPRRIGPAAPRPTTCAASRWAGARPKATPTVTRPHTPGPRPARGDGRGRAGRGAGHKGGAWNGNGAPRGFAAPGTGRGVRRRPDGAEWGVLPWNEPGPPTGGRTKRAVSGMGAIPREPPVPVAGPFTDWRGRACSSAPSPLRERESFPATRTRPAEWSTAAAGFIVPAAPGCGPGGEER